MTAEPEDGDEGRSRFRDQAWGDEPQEADASELIEEIESTRPDLARRWQDHPTFVPFKIVGRFIRRSGKRVAVTIAGGLLVLAGLAGLVLPIIPGWLLIIPGLALLATEYVWAQRLLKIAKEKATQAKDLMLGKKKQQPEESPES